MASNYALRTRSSAEDPIFGNYLEQLPSNKLPTMTEIYRNFLFRKESEIARLFQRNKKVVKCKDSTTTKNKIITELYQDLKLIWRNGASIPVRDDKNLFVEVKNLIDKGADFAKDSKTWKSIGKEEYLKRKGFDKIFDISRCRYVSHSVKITELSTIFYVLKLPFLPF